jgi:uncharacterized protein
MAAARRHHAREDGGRTTDPFVAASADDHQAPDAFAQMPASQTSRIQKLRYLSELLAEDVTIAGPSVLNLYAAIDQDDTNWIIILKDVDPDVVLHRVYHDPQHPSHLLLPVIPE